MNGERLTNINIKNLLSDGPVSGTCAAPDCSFIGPLPVFYFGAGLSFGTCSVEHWNANFAAAFGGLESLFGKLFAAAGGPGLPGPRYCDNCARPIEPYSIPAERQFCSENCAVYYHGGPKDPAPVRKFLIDSIDAIYGEPIPEPDRCEVCDAIATQKVETSIGWLSHCWDLSHRAAIVESHGRPKSEPLVENPCNCSGCTGRTEPDPDDGIRAHAEKRLSEMTEAEIDDLPAWPITEPDRGDCAFCERPIISNVFYEVGDARVCSTTCRARQMVSNREKIEAETQRIEARDAAIVRILDNWKCTGPDFEARRADLFNSWPLLYNALYALASNSEPVE